MFNDQYVCGTFLGCTCVTVDGEEGTVTGVVSC